MSLLDEILRKRDEFEGAGFAGLKGPEDEPEEGDQVVGTLPDELKPLYFVMEEAAKRDREFHEGVEERLTGRNINCLPENEQKEILREHARIENEYTLARACFECEIRAAFLDHADEESIALRKGWQIVIYKPKPRLPRRIIIAIPLSGLSPAPVHDLGPGGIPDA